MNFYLFVVGEAGGDDVGERVRGEDERYKEVGGDDVGEEERQLLEFPDTTNSRTSCSMLESKSI